MTLNPNGAGLKARYDEEEFYAEAFATEADLA